MTRITQARTALVVIAAAALVLAATAAARTHASPIVIGWAFDSKGGMAPFDGPALAAAPVRVKEGNAKGGVGGPPPESKACATPGRKPTNAKGSATELLGPRANVSVP